VLDEVEVEPGVTVVVFNLDERYGFRYIYGSDRWTSDNSEANSDLSKMNYIQGIKYIVGKVEESGQLMVGNDVIKASDSELVKKLDEVKNGVVQRVEEQQDDPANEGLVERVNIIIKSGSLEKIFSYSSTPIQKWASNDNMANRELNNPVRSYEEGIKYIVGRVEEGDELFVGGEQVAVDVGAVIIKLKEIGDIGNIKGPVGKSKYRFKNNEIVDDDTLESTNIYLSEENSVLNLYLRVSAFSSFANLIGYDQLIGRIDFYENIGKIIIDYEGKWTEHMRALNGLFINLEDEDDWIYYSIE
jgi:hypothetical protein